MKKLLLILAALSGLANAQANAGGAQSAPPMPNQVGTNVSTNGTFAGNTTGWTVGGSGCAVYDGTQTATADGTGSLKLTNCAPTSTAVTILTQNESIAGGHEAFRLSFKVKSDATTPVVTFLVVALDNTHGSVIPVELETFPSDFMNVGPSSDWVQVHKIIMTPPYLHSGDTWQFQTKVISQTGNIWIDEVKAQPVWFPIRTFIKYPNWRYLWTDVNTPAWLCGGTYSIDAATGKPVTTGHPDICGVAEIDPVPGVSLAQSTLTVTTASVQGCGAGVLNIQTFVSPLAVQPFQITPAQYGALVNGTKYFICSTLTVTAGGAVQGYYSDWAVVPEPSSFRSGLMNWIAEDGSWYHNQKQQFAFGTYDRWGSNRYGTKNTFKATSDCSSYVTSPVDIADCYKRGVRGFDVTALPKATPSGKTPAGSVMADYSANHFNMVMSINPGASFNPTPGANDSFTPYMSALRDFGASGMQILNQNLGYIISESNNASGQPNGGIAPIASVASGGSLATGTNRYAYLLVTAVGWALPQGSVSSFIKESAPTNIISLNMSLAPCAPSSCAIALTIPSCDTPRVMGFRAYWATNDTGIVPAPSTFDRIYPTYTGKLTDQDPLPCGAATTFAGGSPVPKSGIAPPGTDTTDITNRQTWNGGLTDKATWKLYTDSMLSHTGAAGVYLADESVLLAAPTTWYMHNYISGVANGMLTWATLQFASGETLYRDGVDVINNDPYSYALGAGPDEREFGPLARSAIGYDSTNNHLGSIANAYPNRVDTWTDAFAHDVYGARPQWFTVQVFNRGAWNAYPYAEVWRQYVKATIGCQNWGSLGCGVIGWGRVSGQGMENSYYVDGNTNSWTDELNANNAFAKYIPALLTPVLDSTHLRTGSVVTSVSNTGAIGTVCANAVGSGGYQNATNFPDGPIRHADHALYGDIYIFATNLCDGKNMAITGTIDSGARTLTRSAGDFVSDGVTSGIRVSMIGFTNSGNNTTCPVASLTATVITFTAACTSLVTEGPTASVIANFATTVTFNLASVPGGQTQVEVEDETGHRSQLTITAGSFSDSWTSMGAYVYVIRNPRRSMQNGVTRRSGKTTQ